MIDDNCFDKDGSPITLRQCEELWSDNTYRTIEKTRLPYGGMVSTIWLGFNHNFDKDAPPLIFETMVFPDWDKGDFTDSECYRYSTPEEARQGHEKVVSRLLPKPDRRESIE